MEKYKLTAFDLKLALMQYYRFNKQCMCVDECKGADILADTGSEFIEVEVKITKSDLMREKKKKRNKHHRFKTADRGSWNQWYLPNRFLFCVPEKLSKFALDYVSELNSNYGVIIFNTELYLQAIQTDCVYWQQYNYFLTVVKSAKKLHNDYNKELKWNIAMRTSAKIISLMKR
ncbi:hypothetical protein LCGC14_0358890 [marine sediment metagenome]|uniref:Uncharacterized protein n=1 Tax=marine sediment metagenome TaxID=412755 RepID=A0A0F9TEG2_9ZZZZ